MSISVPTLAYGARLSETNDDWFARQGETNDDWVDRLGETLVDWFAFLQTATHGPRPPISEDAYDGFEFSVSSAPVTYENAFMLRRMFIILRQKIDNHNEGDHSMTYENILKLMQSVAPKMLTQNSA
jgi:hypothetical protein